MTKSETALLREQVRDFASRLGSVESDFASYHAMAGERHTQDEIEKDAEITACRGPEAQRHVREPAQPDVDKLGIQPQTERVPQKAGGGSGEGHGGRGREGHGRAGSPRTGGRHGTERYGRAGE